MNEISQQIKFNTSKLDWDSDISLLQAGNSKYALNVVPGHDEHLGVRTNCLGTTEKSIYSDTSAIEITTTETRAATTTVFTFTVSTLPDILEVEVMFNGELKFFYARSAVFSTIELLLSGMLLELQKYYGGKIYTQSIGATSFSVTFYFKEGDNIELLARTRTLATYPANATIIGSYYDNLTDETYYWAHHASGYRLFKYSHAYGIVFGLPITGNPLTNRTSQVVNPFAIGTERKRLLYWCYKNGTVHKVNTYKCFIHDPAVLYNTTDSNILKKPPLEYATVAYNSSAEIPSYDKYYQLLVRNKFYDGERSVFSMLTGLLYPKENSENSIGLSGGVYSRNEFEITLPSESHAEYTEYECAIRANNGEWNIIDISDFPSDVITINPEYKTVAPVAPTDANRLFDYVPIQTGSCHLVNNRIILADCTEGYENTDIDVTLAESNRTDGIGGTVATISAASGTVDATHQIYIVPSMTVLISYCVYIKTTLGEYYVYVKDVQAYTQAQLLAYINNYINTNIVPIDSAIISATSTTTSDITIEHGVGFVSGAWTYLMGYVKQRAFKDNAINYLGIVYYDKYGRCSGVNVSEDSRIYINPYNYQSYLKGIAMSLASTPPEWAYYYRIFYGGSSITWYKQALLKKTHVQMREGDIKIWINEHLTSVDELNQGYNGGSYVFNKGDKIRFICYSTDGMTYTSFTNAIDADILYQDEDAIYINNVPPVTFVTEFDTATHITVELYRPTIEQPIEYFETEYYGIIDGAGTATRHHHAPYNSESQVNQTTGVPMSCVLPGFEHVIQQTYYMENGYAATMYEMSESFSNYFDSKNKGLGRVNFYNPDFNKIRRNILRASNVYIPNTEINGLSTFEYANELQVDDQFGKITDIKLVGDVLKVIQPHKVGAMYLGAQMATDAQGNQMLLYSDKVLTSIRYGDMDYGTMHPESVVVHNSYVYFLDVINSVVCRDTPGGTFPISDARMKSYFRYKIRTLLASCGYSFRAYGAYDYQNEIYLLTLIDPYNSTNNETIGFHEPSESWCSFYSFTPEQYASIPGDYLLSFKDGKLYSHDSATRNTFYGTAYDSTIWVVSNIYPDQIKIWKSIAVNSNYVWNAEDNDGVIIDSDHIEYTDPQNYTRHKGGMVSRLKEGKFRHFEGEYRADFLRDATTNYATFQHNVLFNGRPLRGKTCLVKLNNSSTSAVYLRGVRINAQIPK